MRRRSFIPPLRSCSDRSPLSRKSSGDRFIPDRSAMDLDFAHYALTETRKEKEKAAAAASPSSEAYRKLLAWALFGNRTRILSFSGKPPAPRRRLLVGAHHRHRRIRRRQNEATKVHISGSGEDAGPAGPGRRLLPQPARLGKRERAVHRPREHGLPVERHRRVDHRARDGGRGRRARHQRRLGSRWPAHRRRAEQLPRPAVGLGQQPTAEDTERGARVSGRVARVERQPPDDGGKGREDSEQGRQDESPRSPDVQGTHAGGVWAQVVGVGAATGERGQRQPAAHLGPLHGLVGAPVGGPHGGGEGAGVVPVPEQPAGLGRGRQRPVHQALERSHGGLPELGRHGVAGLLAALEQGGEGAAQLSRLHPQPAHPLEVPVHVQDGRAHWSHFPGPLHGPESGWVHRCIRSGRGGPESEILECFRDSLSGGQARGQGECAALHQLPSPPVMNQSVGEE